MKSNLRPTDSVYIICPHCHLPFIKPYGEILKARRHNCPNPNCRLFLNPEVMSVAVKEALKNREKALEILSRQDRKKKR